LELVVDTSVIIAVISAEATRDSLIRAARGAELVAPASVHWEVGNAVAALIKRRLATRDQAVSLLSAYAEVPLRLMEVDLVTALELAADYNLYAYDAYVLTCALSQRAALLTLDKGQARAAAAAGIRLREVEA
jgi:predicted nucleic acid-binding protein